MGQLGVGTGKGVYRQRRQDSKQLEQGDSVGRGGDVVPAAITNRRRQRFATYLMYIPFRLVKWVLRLSIKASQ